MAHAPHPQCFKYRAECAAVRRELILHAKRRFLTHGPCHDAVSFELTQVFAQHFDRHSGHQSSKLAKSTCSFPETAKDHWFPSTLDHADRRVNGTLIAFDIACILFAHASNS